MGSAITYYAVQGKYEILPSINSASASHLVLAKAQTNDLRASWKYILLLGDSRERIQQLLAALNNKGLKISVSDALEEVSNLNEFSYDLAIVTLRPEKLTQALKMLRKNQQHADVPILVERSFLLTNQPLAGVLPTYRAMPCSLPEIVKLTRRYLTASASPNRKPARRVRAIL